MNKIDKLAKMMSESVDYKEKKKTQAYDTTAKVIKVEGNKAWIQIPGGVEKTPASMVVNAKEGDEVRVRVSGGKAYITGNVTAPPTDDTAAMTAQKAAESATKNAMRAYNSAESASKSAQSALKDAETANESANKAIKDAENAREYAEYAQASAEEAAEAASTAEGKAEQAITAAGLAQGAADSALSSANSALAGLEIVQDVAGTLEWIKEHGSYELSADATIDPNKVYFILDGDDYVPIAIPAYTYELSEDTEVVTGKTYYERTGSGTSADPYVYTEIQTPTGNPSTSGYYERLGPADQGWCELNIRDSQSDFIMAHLAVTSRGLWVLPNGKSTEEYKASTDEEVDTSKVYYERSGSGTAADPYVYTIVTPAGTEDPSEEGWYETLTEEERVILGVGYKALLTNTGLEVYDETGICVSKFGENIEFRSTRDQRIGGPDAYIEYNNANGILTIAGSQVYFSQIDDKVSSLRNEINTELTIVEGDINTLQERAEIVDSAVIIDPSEPSVTVLSSPSQVKIKSNSIELKGGANATTFITPDGMETTSLTAKEIHPRVEVQGQAVGPFSFLARENGHFSLKKAR